MGCLILSPPPFDTGCKCDVINQVLEILLRRCIFGGIHPSSCHYQSSKINFIVGHAMAIPIPLDPVLWWSLPLTFNKLIFSLVFFTAGHLHFPVFQAVVYSLRFNIAQSFTSHPTLLGFLSICVTCGIPYEQKFPLLPLLDDTDSSTHSCHPGYSFSTLRLKPSIRPVSVVTNLPLKICHVNLHIRFTDLRYKIHALR